MALFQWPASFIQVTHGCGLANDKVNHNHMQSAMV